MIHLPPLTKALARIFKPYGIFVAHGELPQGYTRDNVLEGARIGRKAALYIINTAHHATTCPQRTDEFADCDCGLHEVREFVIGGEL